MNYWNFLLYTTLGAGAWNCILAALGWYLHSIVPEEQLHDEILKYGEYLKWGIIGLVLIVACYFAVRHFIKKKKQ